MVRWPTPDGPAACKRLPSFPDRASFQDYEILFDDYLTTLETAGVPVVPSSLVPVPKAAGRAAYIVQPALDRDLLAPEVLGAGHDRATELFDEIFAHLVNAIEAGAGFDAQIANWALSNETLVYFDVTTPLLRNEAGSNRLDARVFLASLPWALRGFVRRFLVDSIIDTYHQIRTAMLDVLGNLIKERLRSLIPTALRQANRRLADPITMDEVERFYRRDARLWEFLIRLRRLDRAWQLRVRRRPYPFLLPGRIDR